MARKVTPGNHRKQLPHPTLTPTPAGEGKTTLPVNASPVLYIAPMGEKAAVYALAAVEKLRAKGIYAECDIASRSLKAQMKYADKIGAEYVLVVGDNELESGKALLKNMRDKEDRREVELDNLPF